MTIEKKSNEIIKTGICRYGSKQYRLFLCTSTFFPGTGDFEDAPEIRDDRGINFYCIWLEDIVNTGNISAGAGYYKQLSYAIRAAESSGGFERWVE